jgi:carboxyl-terminal processing protease
MKFKRKSAWVLATLLLIINCSFKPAEGHHYNAKEIYHHAWELVRENYYDSSFNGINWSEYEHKYDNQIESAPDAFKAIKKMLESLKDPYTRFLDARAFQDENDAIDAHIVGIGINLQQSRDQTHLIITRTIENSPAERAGLAPGDELMAIDNACAVGITPEQAAEHIRGKAGTPVKLAIKHAGNQQTVQITRQEIEIRAVQVKMFDSGIGYIQLSTFISSDAAREFRRALSKLSGAKGIILDLRDNPGGLLANALEMADMLLDGGTIVSTIGRHGRHTDVSSGQPLTKQPIVVLVDEESASASEILASAIKDNGRGIVLGTRTYGKGLVQEINRLPGGAALHITVSRYLTPNGSDINKVGIEPDILIENKTDQVNVAYAYLKDKIACSKQTGKHQLLSSIPYAKAAFVAGHDLIK